MYYKPNILTGERMMTNHVLYEMIRYFGKDASLINHTLKVYGFACAIAEEESVSKELGIVVRLAALLHDIGVPEAVRKHQSAAGNFQEMEGPIVAKQILGERYPRDIVERVLYLVGNHHSYSRIDGTDFQILVEADFLVNLDEAKSSRDEALRIGEKYFKTHTGGIFLKWIY
jgi:hypothetical protein